MPDCRGFAVTALLVFLPVLLAILALLASAYLLFRVDGQSRHLCRVELLKSQAKVGDFLNELLSLNPEAARLRIRREGAELQVRLTAGIPGANAVAAANLAVVQAQQIVLAARQKLLLARAHAESFLGPRRAARILTGSISEAADVFAGTHARPFSSSAGGQFDVRARPAQSLTPHYEPAPDFVETQSAQVRWRIQIESLLPVWVRSFISLGSLQLNADCSATLREEEKKWKPVLNAVKP